MVTATYTSSNSFSVACCHMLRIRYSTYGIPHEAQYFAKRPGPWRPNFRFLNCRDVGKVCGFARLPRWTKLIDLTGDEITLLGEWHREDRRDMRRAERRGASLHDRGDVGAFVQAYSAFARRRGLPQPRLEEFCPIEGSGEVLSVTDGEGAVIMCYFLLDPQGGRVRIQYAVCDWDLASTSISRQHFGQVHRFLCWKAMLRYKRLGFDVFDLGGYIPGATDRKIAGINSFKDGFGGVLTAEANYYPWPVGPLVAARWRRRRARETAAVDKNLEGLAVSDVTQADPTAAGSEKNSIKIDSKLNPIDPLGKRTDLSDKL